MGRGRKPSEHRRAIHVAQYREATRLNPYTNHRPIWIDRVIWRGSESVGCYICAREGQLPTYWVLPLTAGEEVRELRPGRIDRYVPVLVFNTPLPGHLRSIR